MFRRGLRPAQPGDLVGIDEHTAGQQRAQGQCHEGRLAGPVGADDQVQAPHGDNSAARLFTGERSAGAVGPILDDLAILIEGNGGDPMGGKLIPVVSAGEAFLDGRGDLGVENHTLLDAQIVQRQLPGQRGFHPPASGTVLAGHRSPDAGPRLAHNPRVRDGDGHPLRRSGEVEPPGPELPVLPRRRTWLLVRFGLLY